MASVKAKSSFIGTPEEMEKYGGQVPDSMKKYEKRMSEGEKASFQGKINAGTVMQVDEKREKELAELGLIEGSEKAHAAAEEKKKAQAKNVTQPVIKEKAETKGLPNAKKR